MWKSWPENGRMMRDKEQLFWFPMPLWVPGVLSLLSVFGAFLSPWALLAVPFVWLGALCSAPNLNLADGCLAWIAIVIGFVLMFFWPPGYLISVSTALSWFLSGFERMARARPVDHQ